MVAGPRPWLAVRKRAVRGGGERHARSCSWRWPRPPSRPSCRTAARDVGVKTRTVSFSAQRILPATALPPTETVNARAVLRRSIALGEADRDRRRRGRRPCVSARGRKRTTAGALTRPDGEQRRASSGRPSASRTPDDDEPVVGRPGAAARTATNVVARRARRAGATGTDRARRSAGRAGSPSPRSSRGRRAG